MYFESIVGNIKSAINKAEKIAGKNVALNILNSFLIDCTEKGVYLYSTNLEIGIKTRIRGEFKKEGISAIPVKIFSSFISSLPTEKKIIITSNGRDIELDIDSHKTIIKGYDYNDFPPFPNIKHDFEFLVEKQQFISALRRASVCVAPFNIKPELTSILFDYKNNILKLAATDSFRLAEEKLLRNVISTKEKSFVFLVPIRTAEEIIRLFEQNSDQQIKFKVSNKGLFIESSQFILFSRLIEGKFPEYSSIIPTKFNTNAKLIRNTVLENIKRARIFSGKLNDLNMLVDTKGGVISFSAKNSDVGEFQSKINADASGADLSVVVNWKYLIDGVGSFEDKELFFGFNGELDPILLRSEDGLSIHVIMPMRGV